MVRVLGPSTELAQKVVRSTEIAGGKLTLIGFTPAPDDSLVGHLLIERSPGRFEHLAFQSCESEGAAPELLAVFFARTVKDGGRDLAVLCRWEQRHATVNGMLYGAEFYRLKEKDSKLIVEPVTDLNKKFETDDLVRQNDRGKWVQGPRARFSTVAQVKKLLTKMGLKQWERSGAGRAAGRDVACWTDHGCSRGAVDDVAALGAGQGGGAVDDAAGAGRAGRMTGRGRAAEGAVAAGLADALAVRTGPGAAAARLAGDVARRGLAGERARAAAAAGAGAVRADGLAAPVVPFAGRVAGGRRTDEAAVIAGRAGTGSAVAPLDGASASRRGRDEGDEGREGERGEEIGAGSSRHARNIRERPAAGFSRRGRSRAGPAGRQARR
jgi:hypothetical protein